MLNGGPAGFAAYRAGRPAVVSAALAPTWDVPLLHRWSSATSRSRPTPVDPRARSTIPRTATTRAEAARFTLNWLSATGTAILLAALVSALYLRVPFGAGPRDRAA